MFTQSAKYYDLIYATAGKDYNREADLLHGFVQQHKRSNGKALLDVACGTGGHMGRLQTYYAVTGLDLDSNILEVAKQNFPAITFHQADMADFELHQTFDVVACLFSSIGYVKTIERLRQAICTMSRHLTPGGVLLVEPWFEPGVLTHGYLLALHVDQPDLKITRMSNTTIDGTVSTLHFHYLIGTHEGVKYEYEQHELGLFTPQEYLSAFEAANLTTTFEPHGLEGRGLYIGVCH